MKKLMIALAALTVGVVAQAATVDWSMTVTGSAVDYSASNFSVYLVDAAKWDAAKSGGGITADTFADNTIVYGQTTFAAGTGKSATSKAYATKDNNGSKGTYASALSDTIVGTGDTLDVYYVILDTSKDPSVYYASEKATLTGRLATGTEIQTGFGSVANSSVSWTATGAVPEPTSGLLMLLGLAGLALKRKRA